MELLWTELFPPRIQRWKAYPSVWLHLELGPLQKSLKLNEFIRMGPWYERIRAFVGRNIGELPLSSHHVRTLWLDGHLQTRKRAFSSKQTGWHLDLGLPSLSEGWEIKFCYLSHLGYGVLLWRMLTNTDPTEVLSCFLLFYLLLLHR